MRCIWILTLLATIGFMSPAIAQDPAEKHLTLGFKVWHADNGQEESSLLGWTLLCDISRNTWISGMYLAGEYEQPGDTEKNADAELLVGYSLPYVDVGLGFRYLVFDTDLHEGWDWWPEEEIGYNEGAQRNSDIYGPMIFAGSSHVFGESPFGVYGEFSWLFKDFGQNDDLGFDGSHFNLEVGSSFHWRRMILMLGYRYKQFSNLPPLDIRGEKFDHEVIDGFTGSIHAIF